MLSPFEQELRGRISGKRAISYIEALVATGDRFVGSDGDARAAHEVRARFGGWGLEVVDREFTTLGYRHGRVELALADGRRFEAIPPYFSPPTPSGGVRGELVYVGAARRPTTRASPSTGRSPSCRRSGSATRASGSARSQPSPLARA